VFPRDRDSESELSEAKWRVAPHFASSNPVIPLASCWLFDLPVPAAENRFVNFLLRADKVNL